MRPYATSACGLQVLVYGAFTYWCMRPSEATSVFGLSLLVYEALATSVCGPKVPVYAASSYLVAQEVLEVEVVALAEQVEEAED